MTALDPAKLLEGTTAGPWSFSTPKYEPKEPWPTDHPLLPSEEPKESWTLSIFGNHGGQVIRHEAHGWRPSDADLALIAAAPDLARSLLDKEKELAEARAILERMARFFDSCDECEAKKDWSKLRDEEWAHVGIVTDVRKYLSRHSEAALRGNEEP